MPLVEPLYCTQQINVPPTLPNILKQFCKAAIRTQPYDLLKWSSTYFRALADGEELPIKFRLEYPPPSTESGLTLGFLKVLLRQFGDYNKNLSLDTFTRRWDGLCLDHIDLELIVSVGGFRNKAQVKKFLSIGVALLSNSLHETMIMICELFTHEPEGGSAMIPLKLFMDLYSATVPTMNPWMHVDRKQIKLVSCVSVEPVVQLKYSIIERSGEYANSDDNPEIDSSSVELVHDADEEDSNRSEKSTTPSLRKHETGMDVEKNKQKYDTGKPKIQPNVLGIGPRLSPEHIPSVENWMSECAILQEGMVGPRNLRHFQCPSLDNPKILQHNQ